ncbi:FG-GAP repeat protein [Arenibacter sp. ARW7G5Y1]|nr:FG-GAP repeat protein [Arenibacter sp. ARW7G5Y1]
MIAMIIRSNKNLVLYLLVPSILLINACSGPNQGATTLLELIDANETGIFFSNDIKEGYSDHDNVLTYTNFYNGGGVAVGDIDNDGLIDIYLSSNQKSGKLYLNQGNFKFKDITNGSGLDSIPGWKTGVTMVDINQDGFLDIYLCRSGRLQPQLRTNLLYVNNGDHTFTEKAKEYGLNDSANSIQSSFFDYDQDGDLDMYLLNHAVDPVRELSKPIAAYENDTDTADKLYRNDDGYYTEIGASLGIDQSVLGDGLGIAIGDLSNNGIPDIYVCNDFLGRDFLYRNLGDGKLKEDALQAMNHISSSSMGVDMADIDNDGWQDLFVVDMKSSTNFGSKTNMASMNPKAFEVLTRVGGHYQYMRNTLQLNNGNGTFSDIAPMAGLSSTDWSWAPLFVDLDNDGYKDLFVTNGIRKNTNNKDYDNYRRERIQTEMNKIQPDIPTLVKEILGFIPPEIAVNPVYKNTNGLHFEKMNDLWGVQLPSYSNGAAYADLDNDGDMDLIVNNIDEVAHIYKNNASKLTDNRYLTVQLKGKHQNLNAIGAKVMLQSADGKQFLEQQVTRGYQSSIDHNLHFGLGKNAKIDLLQVNWPDGKISELRNLESDQLVVLDYQDAIMPTPKQTTDNNTIFFDRTVESGIVHEHMENGFDDFEREVLLPHKMSTFGPALAVGDINNDGLQDFFIGGAKGYEGAIYLQNNDETFSKLYQKAMVDDKFQEDIDALFFDADNDGDQDLYVVSGGNEMPIGDMYYQDRLYLNDGKGQLSRSKTALPIMTSSGGVVKANDFDKDGDLDLFVGGRLLPGQYPRSGRSYLLENVNGNFKDITSTHGPELEYPGMVTDALWSDQNNDGTQDLILVGEWMPITVFQNKAGKLVKVEGDPILEKSNGWWFSISEADINNDGVLDYVLGNLGENYKYKAKPRAPFNLYSSDFDNNGELDIVLSFYQNDTLFPLRGKECSTQQIPSLKKKFKDYTSFAAATLEDVYDRQSLEKATHYLAHTFSNSILINKSDGFELKKMPLEAQVSSVFGSLYDDFDGDGLNDLVIAGNLFNSEVETPRNDAGTGLFLKGDGSGNFEPIKNYTSGLHIPGDVKKMKSIIIGKNKNPKKGLLIAANNDFVRLLGVAQ